MANNIYTKLLQKKWFRNFFSESTYFLVSDTKSEAEAKWVIDKDFKKGQFIHNINGKWYSQFFCSECHNELIHSDSFISGNQEKGIVEYVCSYCKKHQYGNLGIIPGILHCDVDGNPINLN